jgi:hypothetical protein
LLFSAFAEGIRGCKDRKTGPTRILNETPPRRGVDTSIMMP